MGSIAVTAGIILAIMMSKSKNKKSQDKESQNEEPLENGLYTVDVFKKITCDMNNSIAETEKRLGEHDNRQKMYDEMEWNTSNN